MKRFLFAVVVVGVLFNAGPSFAQDKDAPQMPEKVRQFLENFAGTWNYDGNYKGSVTRIWDAGKGSLIATGQEQFGDVPANWSELVYWDGISDDRIVFSVVFTASKGISCMNIHGKVLSPTLMEGKLTGVSFGKKASENIQIKFKGEDQYISRHTNRVVNGENQSDETLVYTRVKPTTRKDFEEYCKLNEGAWVGKVPLRDDMPGVGKKGDIATAHYDYTIIEDGIGLLGKSYWPGGTNTWLIAYDEENQQIKSIGISPIFGVDSPIIHYKNRIWTCRERAMNPDGTKYEATITGTFSEDGKTMTVTVSGPKGEKVIFTDVWRRMNK